MYRQSPSRNQRSKGVKVKYAIQICLLLAVSFWLIYQVKHSHDKKKEFDETEAKTSLHMHNSNGKNPILGRKGINAQDDEITSMKGDKPHESIEEEENVEEEENKPEEDGNKTEEDKNKSEEGENKTEDENKPGEDKNKEEDEHEEKYIDHEQENLDSDENEAREVDSGDGQTVGENSLSNDNDHDGNVNNNKSTREARDENYKADDASSAVTHEAQTETSENVNVRKENSNVHPEINMLEEHNKEARKDLEVEGGEIASVDQKSNVMISEANVELLESSENGSPPNDTLIIENSSRDLTSNGSAEVEIENHGLSKPKLELDNDLQANGFDSNLTYSTETKDVELQQSDDFSNSSNNSMEFLLPDSSVRSGNKTESSSETEDEMEVEKSDLNIGTYEKSESTVTENPEEEIQHGDGIDESDALDLLEEKHIRNDLDTLPEIQTEGTNGEDDVATE